MTKTSIGKFLQESNTLAEISETTLTLSNALSLQAGICVASFGKLIDFRIIEQHHSSVERLSVKMIFKLISSTDLIMRLHRKCI